MTDNNDDDDDINDSVDDNDHINIRLFYDNRDGHQGYDDNEIDKRKNDNDSNRDNDYFYKDD